MPSVQLGALSGRYLSFAEREDIALWRVQGHGVRAIARRLGRSPSTVSRELRRNAATRGGKLEYRAGVAQWKAELMARRPETAKLVCNDRLRGYVQDRLAGTISRPGGEPVAGPEVRFVGRRHGRRADRRWSKAWSPEQISNRLRVDFVDDESMRISHEAIYQALYVQGRGALRREFVACLRTGRALRVPRARSRGRGKKFVSDEIMISERPPEVDDRAVPGHWEGDLILGLDSSAIGTLVERSTRFTMLLHLPPMDGHRQGPRAKNGPALAGHGAQAVRDAIAAQIATLPRELRRSLTWDQGAEMAPRPAPHSHRPRRLVLRPAVPMAARHQREHQRPAAPVLPQPHRPRPTHPTRPRRSRSRPQHPTPKNPQLENPSRSPQRTPTLTPTSRCCDDRLNPPNIFPSATASGSPTTTSSRRSEPAAIPMTTR